ncbi:MAG: hypothetical protein ACFE0J_22275 [Elainellaceae cyanobacterium]
MNHYVRAVTMTAISALAIGVFPNTASSDNRGYNTDVQTIPGGGAIDRETFQYVNEQGGWMDENGYYRRPIPVNRVYSNPVSDGTHEHRMNWEPQHSIIFEVENQRIIRQDYILRRSTDKEVSTQKRD